VASIPKGQEDKAAARWIAGAGPKATATVKLGDPRDFSKPLQFEAEFEIKEAVTLDSPGAFRIPTNVTNSPLSSFASGSNQIGPRKNAFVCASDSRTEELAITLPSGIAVAALPKAADFKGKTIHYASSYRQDGNVINVKRTLTRDRPSRVCGPEMWSEAEELSAAIARDMRAQVLLK
jgi:hypothetical protein